MLGMGAWLGVSGHKSAPLVLTAAAVFLASLTMRSIDRPFCYDWVVYGQKVGTHFLWHLLNAVTLYLLLAAAIRHGTPVQAVFPPRPKTKLASYEGK